MLKPKEIALLFRFYERSQHYQGGGFFADSISEQMPGANPASLTVMLGRLRSLDYVERKGTGSENRNIYAITAQGEIFLESLFEEDSKALADAIEFLGSASKEQEPQAGEAAEVEPEWSPLVIERVEPEYIDALKALEDAAKSVESDNGYAATAPIERAEVVIRLRGAIELLKSAPALTASAIQVYIVWPMEKLASRFSPATVTGAALKFAWDTLSTWIKKRGGELLDGIFQ